MFLAIGSVMAFGAVGQAASGSFEQVSEAFDAPAVENVQDSDDADQNSAEDGESSNDDTQTSNDDGQSGDTQPSNDDGQKSDDVSLSDGSQSGSGKSGDSQNSTDTNQSDDSKSDDGQVSNNDGQNNEESQQPPKATLVFSNSQADNGAWGVLKGSGLLPGASLSICTDQFGCREVASSNWITASGTVPSMGHMFPANACFTGVYAKTTTATGAGIVSNRVDHPSSAFCS